MAGGREVEDRKAAMREQRALLAPQPAIIRTALGEPRDRRLRERFVRRSR